MRAPPVCHVRPPLSSTTKHKQPLRATTQEVSKNDMLLATDVLKQVLEPLVSGVFAGVHHIRDVHHSSSQLEEARLGVVGERREPHRLKRLVHEFLKEIKSTTNM